MAKSRKKVVAGKAMIAGQVRKIPIGDLKPSPYNPRKITKAARSGLKSSIDRFGLVGFPVWNKQTGHIVGGNQRYDLLLESGKTHVSVHVVDLPLIEEKLLNVALNSPTLQGTFTDDVQAIVAELRDQIDDLPEPLNFKRLVADVSAAVDVGDEIPATFVVMVQVKNEGQQTELFERLEKEGFSCRLLTT